MAINRHWRSGGSPAKVLYGPGHDHSGYLRCRLLRKVRRICNRFSTAEVEGPVTEFVSGPV